MSSDDSRFGKKMNSRSANENQNEAADVIHKSIARIQLACSRPVKRMHCDGDNEQYCGKLNVFLEKQGIVKFTKAPNSSSSNAMVELGLAIIFGSARSELMFAPH